MVGGKSCVSTAYNNFPYKIYFSLIQVFEILSDLCGLEIPTPGLISWPFCEGDLFLTWQFSTDI